MSHLQRNLATALSLLFLLIVLYVGIAFLVYAFRHPELTDTLRLLHWRDALSWRR